MSQPSSPGAAKTQGQEGNKPYLMIIAGLLGGILLVLVCGGLVYGWSAWQKRSSEAQAEKKAKDERAKIQEESKRINDANKQDSDRIIEDAKKRHMEDLIRIYGPEEAKMVHKYGPNWRDRKK
jgi:uncharacterized protein HemX